MSNTQIYRNRDEYYKTWSDEQIEISKLTNQAVVTATDTLVVWETVLGSGNVTNSSGVININRTGLYRVNVNLPWQSSVVGTRQAWFRLNSDAVKRFSEFKDGTNFGGYTYSNLYMMWHFTKGDTLEVIVRQTSGGNVDLIGATADVTDHITMQINLLQDTN